jgi:hypothetical protein
VTPTEEKEEKHQFEKEEKHQFEDKCEDQLMLQSSVECNVDVDLMNELYEVCEW